MSGVTCDQIRAAVLDPGTAPERWLRRPDVASHVKGCTSCQDWFDAFAAGERAWVSEPADTFAAGVVAHTTGVEEVVRDLPSLAEMDPGPGFTARVLMATSWKPAPEGWRARAAAVWQSLVRRPRFAWEAAYVATVCWVLLFGNPVGAFEWSASNIGAVARERLGGPVEELQADLETWRARLATDSTPAAGAASGGQAEAAPLALRAWQASTAFVQRLTGPVLDVIKTAWERVAGWVVWLVGQFTPAPTEPPADSARSRQ